MDLGTTFPPSLAEITPGIEVVLDPGYSLGFASAVGHSLKSRHGGIDPADSRALEGKHDAHVTESKLSNLNLSPMKDAFLPMSPMHNVLPSHLFRDVMEGKLVPAEEENVNPNLPDKKVNKKVNNLRRICEASISVAFAPSSTDKRIISRCTSKDNDLEQPEKKKHKVSAFHCEGGEQVEF